MTCLILMRHGNTFEEGQTPLQVGARTDLPLTCFGKEQAKKMAQTLKGKCPQAIFTGSLKRQTESAAIIAGELGLAVQYTSALTEIDYGLWEGLAAKQIAQKWPREYAEWTNEAKWQPHIFAGSLENHQATLQKWLKTLWETFPNGVVFGVTSNGLLRFIHKEKVKTGHFCTLFIHQDRLEIFNWNVANE